MSKMSNFRGQWSQAPVMYTSEFQTPEDGQYRVVIEDVKYTEEDRDGNPTDPTYIYILRVIDGKNLGIRFRKFQTIRTEKNLSFLKGDLARLGFAAPTDPEEIIILLQRAKGLTIEVTVSSREYNGKTYKDCSIDRRIRNTSDNNANYNSQDDDPNYNPFVQDGRPSQTYQQRQQAQGYDPSRAPNGFSGYGSGGYPDVPF